MTKKELAIEMLRRLPDDASWEDIQERINFMAGVRKGLAELDEGKGLAHETVREEYAQWLTD
jgi:predicted transcriptional regulator